MSALLAEHAQLGEPQTATSVSSSARNSLTHAVVQRCVASSVVDDSVAKLSVCHIHIV
jgi:hypothetical protein